MTTDKENLTGKQFGKLVVIHSHTLGARGSKTWLCKCSCGLDVVVPTKRLKSGNTRSCGCLKSIVTSMRNKALAKDVTGRTFSQWTVLKIAEHRDARGSFLWQCRCSCGREEQITSPNLLRGRSHKCQQCKNKDKHKRFCVNDHDTDIYGRDKYNYCKACVRDRAYRRSYGISLEDFELLYTKQDGKCFLCGIKLQDYTDPESQGKRPEVDHDHSKSGKESIRGLLCGGQWGGCNHQLGKVDKLEWLKKVILYLENPPAQQVFKDKEQ